MSRLVIQVTPASPDPILRPFVEWPGRFKNATPFPEMLLWAPGPYSPGICDHPPTRVRTWTEVSSLLRIQHATTRRVISALESAAPTCKTYPVYNHKNLYVVALRHHVDAYELGLLFPHTRP